MKTTVSVYDFRDAFRSIRPDNFSYEGQGLLFDYFEQFEEDTGQEMELDVIAICCDFSESSIEQIIRDLHEHPPEPLSPEQAAAQDGGTGDASRDEES